MIGPLKVLLRVKQLKEDQALRAMQKKRQEVVDAAAALAERKRVVEDSAATLDDRQDAVYRAILGKPIDLGGLDEAKGRVLRLEQDHQRLIDEMERARHVHHRLEGELEAATQAYRKTVKDKDKYVILTEEVSTAIAAELGLAEENEIEDLFSRPQRKPA